LQESIWLGEEILGDHVGCETSCKDGNVGGGAGLASFMKPVAKFLYAGNDHVLELVHGGFGEVRVESLAPDFVDLVGG
jgi:hypothetical protein